MENFFKKFWWLLLFIIIILLLVIIWLLLTGKTSDQKSSTSTNNTSQSTDQTTSDSKKLTETESDADLLKKAVSEKTGIDIDIIIVDISKNTGKYAKGLVTAEGETVGGGYWLAVKENGKWKIKTMLSLEKIITIGFMTW